MSLHGYCILSMAAVGLKFKVSVYGGMKQDISHQFLNQDGIPHQNRQKVGLKGELFRKKIMYIDISSGGST